MIVNSDCWWQIIGDMVVNDGTSQSESIILRPISVQQESCSFHQCGGTLLWTSWLAAQMKPTRNGSNLFQTYSLKHSQNIQVFLVFHRLILEKLFFYFWTLHSHLLLLFQWFSEREEKQQHCKRRVTFVSLMRIGSSVLCWNCVEKIHRGSYEGFLLCCTYQTVKYRFVRPPFRLGRRIWPVRHTHTPGICTVRLKLK